MLLPSIYLPTSKNIFDLHFTNLILDINKNNYFKLKIDLEDMGSVGKRYEVFLEKNSKGNEEILIGQLDLIPIDKEKVEIRIAALNFVGFGVVNVFFKSFYKMLTDRWIVTLISNNKPITTTYISEFLFSPVYLKHVNLIFKFGVVNQIGMKEFVFENSTEQAWEDWVKGDSSEEYLEISDVELNIEPEIVLATKEQLDLYELAVEETLPPIESMLLIYRDKKTDTNMKNQVKNSTLTNAKAIKTIKDTNPGWTMTKVSMEASHELGVLINENSIRYIYRKLGWKWRKAERTR